MQQPMTRMMTAVDRLSLAVEAMHDQQVACRRGMMVFRARMDHIAGVLDRLETTLTATEAALADAGRVAGAATASFRDAALQAGT